MMPSKGKLCGLLFYGCGLTATTDKCTHALLCLRALSERGGPAVLNERDLSEEAVENQL